MSRQTGVICALREVGDRLTSQMVDTPSESTSPQTSRGTRNSECNCELGSHHTSHPLNPANLCSTL